MSFQLHGDGVPFLIEYEDDDSRFCYVVMMSDIADDPKFKGALETTHTMICKRLTDTEDRYGTILPPHVRRTVL